MTQDTDDNGAAPPPPIRSIGNQFVRTQPPTFDEKVHNILTEEIQACEENTRASQDAALKYEGAKSMCEHLLMKLFGEGERVPPVTVSPDLEKPAEDILRSEGKYPGVLKDEDEE